ANRVADNQTANAMVVSFSATGKPANDRGYDPYPQRIAVHHNTFAGGGEQPDRKNMPALRLGRLDGHAVPDIIWVGVMQREATVRDVQLCIHDNGDADFANIDLYERLPEPTFDAEPHRCTLPSLDAVSWPALAQAE